MSNFQRFQQFTLVDLKGWPKQFGNFITVKFCLSFLVSIWVTFASAEAIVGRVVSVIDGDTIHVVGTDKVLRRIRLAGVDAPETRQAFGQRSKESLSELVFSKTVTVETDKQDRYGREVGKVLVDGVDANLEQVKRGMAWHYKAYEREQTVADRYLYAEAEDKARAAGQGLWADASPIPPWTFRK